ncbi:hypothetical protein MUK42_24741 [Musa troglodytarum]|uniref:Uncharacterized protein n=1 Tax=Musa troglodytarum TaxID=320322 RepID=A0A9E7KAW2_9LILI|nr:hypothetical protein MUK42_24741 [Musa troglodytarum]
MSSSAAVVPVVSMLLQRRFTKGFDNHALVLHSYPAKTDA